MNLEAGFRLVIHRELGAYNNWVEVERYDPEPKVFKDF